MVNQRGGRGLVVGSSVKVSVGDGGGDVGCEMHVGGMV